MFPPQSTAVTGTDLVVPKSEDDEENRDIQQVLVDLMESVDKFNHGHQILLSGVFNKYEQALLQMHQKSERAVSERAHAVVEQDDLRRQLEASDARNSQLEQAVKKEQLKQSQLSKQNVELSNANRELKAKQKRDRTEIARLQESILRGRTERDQDVSPPVTTSTTTHAANAVENEKFLGASTAAKTAVVSSSNTNARRPNAESTDNFEPAAKVRKHNDESNLSNSAGNLRATYPSIKYKTFYCVKCMKPLASGEDLEVESFCNAKSDCYIFTSIKNIWFSGLRRQCGSIKSAKIYCYDCNEMLGWRYDTLKRDSNSSCRKFHIFKRCADEGLDAFDLDDKTTPENQV